MFKNRQNSQKPNEELLASFRNAFPTLSSTARTEGVLPSSTSLTDALDIQQLQPTRHHFGDGEDIKDQDPTPRGMNEPWRFTPSILDPNSFAFSSFANQPPGYYTPTPGGTNTLYHNQAGDLHTPGFSLGLGTPLSLPTSENGLHAGQPTSQAMQSFQQAIAPQMFQNPNPFAMHHEQQTFAPHHFSHQTTHFEPLHQIEEHPAPDGMPDGMADGMHVDIDMQERSPILNFPSQPFDSMRPPPMPQPMESFRWHVTLNAPTAMIKHADEIPVTYLNKGQAYTISIVDTAPIHSGPVPPQYRTFVRISFEDDQQRQRPSTCWQLWKEGRGINEAHHRGGRLQAVEFVDASQVSGGDVPGRPRVEIESASFDGFSVTWTPAPNSPPECSVAVRFNFLSTDFSHSKGVKGIPVRLCAKTELLNTQAPGSPPATCGEISYCKVKLFRDHGAERKLSNDIAHVKKTIDKLKQQIAQLESGLKDIGKRKRSGSVAKASASTRPGKVPKHKRTWSMSSQSSGTGHRPAPAEEDLQIKLQTLQDMFTSTRPVSVLYLKGEEGDDPDVHPVHLTGEPTDLTKIDTTDAAMWDHQSVQTGAGASSIVSPTPSAQSAQSNEARRTSGFQQPTPFGPLSRVSSGEWRNFPQSTTSDLAPQQLITPPDSNSTKVPRASLGRSVSGWIEAVGVDHSYQPPPERVAKPIACFYFLPRVADQPTDDHLYRAIYLMERTEKDLVRGIATKCSVDPNMVSQTVMVNQKGLTILVDDEFVRELPEGQDFIAEFHSIRPASPRRPKREWDSGATDIQVDGDIGVVENVTNEGMELRLLF